MPLPAIDTNYELNDALTATSGRIHLTGTQALLRLLLAQKRRDRELGLNTAGFITGYRGSPLGNVDLTLWRHQSLLREHDIRFLPAINEDLAATMIMGSQQAGMRTDRRVDGVFGMWYGKGPGVDRAGDALHHGNAAGASPHGGVLLIVGDDHDAASSSISHASEAALSAWRIPVIHPATVAEYEWFGLWGWALSRYSGAWVAFKAVTDTVESAASFALSSMPALTVAGDDPHNGALPWSSQEFLTPQMEERMLARLEAVQAFARQFPLDRLHDPAPGARIGIISTGKAFLDTVETLRQLTQRAAPDTLPSIRHYKIGLSWPLDTEGLHTFAQDLDHILVIEEKAPLIEAQIKDALYNLARRPTVCGKQDLSGHPLVPVAGPVNSDGLMTVMQRWLEQTGHETARPADSKAGIDAGTGVGSAVGAEASAEAAVEAAAEVSTGKGTETGAETDASRGSGAETEARTETGTGTNTLRVRPETVRLAGDIGLTRRPWFCSGCPHSTSTHVPEGSEALGGVGCHYMASWMDRNTSGLTQMGAEGTDWIGLAPWVDTPHVFQNMGEGTYFHSGYLAIRQAIAADATMTYKILFNDAVAMTGGQAVDGKISVAQICQQLLGEGVRRIVVTTDEPERYRTQTLGDGIRVYHRRELDRLQRELRDLPGVTVLIHDQTCAAEKRRRRRQGKMPDPGRRLFINTAVCEGCGDCSVQSNCLSVVPVETPFGRKRAIDQSSCNVDERCADGFCPSFVSVIGARPRRRAAGGTLPALDDLASWLTQLPSPTHDRNHETCNILVVGIGGTGVVTLGAIVAMAAHLEGRNASVLDITGLAQKGGTVISHVRLFGSTTDAGPVRVGPGQADVAIVCDVVAGCQPQTLDTLRHGHTHTLVNTWLAPTAEFIRNPDTPLDPRPLLHSLSTAAGPDTTWTVNAHHLAEHYFGDAIMANMVMLGMAWQHGRIPVSADAIVRALELNGVAVETNRSAFALGRLLAWRPEALAPVQETRTAQVIRAPESLETVLKRCRDSLTAWQNAAWAQRYEDIIQVVSHAEQRLRPGQRPSLTVAAARSLHKLMSYKDEYEVARLFTDGDFRKQLQDEFEGEYSLRFHLAPPLLARRDPQTGIPRKITIGPWLEPVFRVLARGKVLRGTWLDPFGWTAERRMERRLINTYAKALLTMAEKLSADNYDHALELAGLALTVRGFGHIKEASVAVFEHRLDELMASLDQVEPAPAADSHPHADGSAA